MNSPISKRATLRRTSIVTGIPKSTLFDVLQRGILNGQNSKFKPALSGKQKIDRLKWYLSFVDDRTLEFNVMRNIVHVNENWFYLTTNMKHYYIAGDEKVPKRSVKNKRYIPKVLFLSAIARPVYDEDDKCIFDRKIGL